MTQPEIYTIYQVSSKNITRARLYANTNGPVPTVSRGAAWDAGDASVVFQGDGLRTFPSPLFIFYILTQCSRGWCLGIISICRVAVKRTVDAGLVLDLRNLYFHFSVFVFLFNLCLFYSFGECMARWFGKRHPKISGASFFIVDTQRIYTLNLSVEQHQFNRGLFPHWLKSAERPLPS